MFHKTTLDNSVRIVTEHIPQAHTVAVGLWVDVGSRDEHDLNNGCAHFVEHMFFKGTASRSAQQVAKELDALGGMANAFTSRENTCFYATVLERHLGQLLELLADLFLRSTFADEEVGRERQVILQEMGMVEDSPDEQIHDCFAARLWQTHPLGNTVLGGREVVAAMDSAKLREYVERYYTPDRIVIAAAGNIDHQWFVDRWSALLADHAWSGSGRRPRQKPPHRPASGLVLTKQLEQVHMAVGTYGLPVTADERYTLYLLNVLLGGNMSSRLFQEIRERHGLAYSIYSDVASYVDSGSLGVFFGVHPRSVNEAVGLIWHEITRLCLDPVSDEELTNAKEFARTGLFLAADNMEARMTRIARNELCFNRYFSLEEVAAGIEAVSAEALGDLAQHLFEENGRMSGVAIGPIAERAIDWDRLR